MVQVRPQPAVDAEGVIDLQLWISYLPLDLCEKDRSRLLAVVHQVQMAQQLSGTDPGDWAPDSHCFIAGLDIALILADLQVDLDCLLAGILYRAVREDRLQLDEVSAQFGDNVASLIVGVLRMAAIGDLSAQKDNPVLGQTRGQEDNIQKMLIALVDDVRVVLIKLAERTCAIRSVKDDEHRRRSVGREVFEVYAPLADRLGIGHLKWELEDLSFRYIYSESYQKIARLLDGKRLERDRFISKVTEELTDILSEAGLDFKIEGRAKHIYSIWKKMQRKGIGFSQVYDIRAVRIIVPEISDCYVALDLVHQLWRNISNEFDDYIVNPKKNGYRSLHAAVIGPEGKTLEIQIRTEDMNEEAELGVCAHWRYKDAEAERRLASTYEEKIAWLREVLGLREEAGDSGVMAEKSNFSVDQDRVYIFTPDGDVVSLAYGATPVDFAYHIHTEIGHRCRGAKVNGSIVPLTYRLKTGERVEILTGSEALPRRDWLQAGQEYLKTSRALSKAQNWFKSQATADSIDTGRHLLEREFKCLNLTSVDYQAIARKVQFNTVEDMFAAVGSGDVSSLLVLNVAHGVVDKMPETKLRLTNVSGQQCADHLEVRGAGTLVTHMARCCKPLPGDTILGFITKSKAVSVHRADCARVLSLNEDAKSRIVELEWGRSPLEHYEVDVVIEAYDRQGLLSEITAIFANARTNVLAINTQTNQRTNTAVMLLRVEVPNLGSLSKLLERIERLKNVSSAFRVRD